MRIYAIGSAVLLMFALFGAPLLNTGPAGMSVAVTAAAQSQDSARDALIERANAFELNTPYVPPPGDPREHDASGFAKIMCSAVFITGLDPAVAAKNVGGFTAPFEARDQLGKPVIDRVNKTVTVIAPTGVKRIARYLGSQGCVTLPSGTEPLHFKPITVTSKLPDGSVERCVMANGVSANSRCHMTRRPSWSAPQILPVP